MSRLELNKSIEATKLDGRSGLPVETRTIAFGSIIHNLREDGTWRKFTFLGEAYRCKQDMLDGALVPVAGSGAAPGGGADASSEEDEAPQVRLRWEELKSGMRTVRAKVPGGWLVALPGGSGNGITFYPDAGHEWDGTTLP